MQDRLSILINEHGLLAGPVHRDLSLANVLADGEDVSIIDLDQLAYGDPLMDIGKFLADLRLSALRATGNLGGFADIEVAFVEEYLALAPHPEARLRLYEAASLLETTGAPFLRQLRGWPESVEALSVESERVLGVAERMLRSSDVVTEGRALPIEQKLAWAADEIYMKARLYPHVAEAYGAAVASCRVGRPRALADGRYSIRYRLSGQLDGERWSTSLRGFLSGKSGGGRSRSRVAVLKAALVANTVDPVLPRPVAYIRELSLVAAEVPAGARVLELVETLDAPRIFLEVGRALVAIERSGASLEKTHSLADEMRSLRGSAARLGQLRPDLRTRAAFIHRQIEERLAKENPRAEPTLRGFRPESLLWDGAHVALSEVRDVVISEPLFAFADLLARLRLRAIKRGRQTALAEMADSIRRAYMAVSGRETRLVATHEAAALLRLASLQAKPGIDVSDQLLQDAGVHLALV